MSVADETVEISQAHLTAYQKAYRLLGSLVNDKEIGTQTKRKLMKIDETVKFTDLDVADAYAEPLKAEIELTKKELAELKKERAEEKTKAEEKETLGDIYSRIDKVVAKRKLTDEGREGLIKTMKERQIADPDAAALVYLDSLPKSEAVRPSGSHAPSKWNLHGAGSSKDKISEKTKRLLESPDDFFDSEVTAVLNEFETLGHEDPEAAAA